MSELTKQQLAALLNVAKANPEFAIQQAFRFGAAAAQSQVFGKAVKRAAEILDYDAESIRQAFEGDFTSEENQDYDERKKVAKTLRGLVPAE
jgi:hypothetical protein